MSPDPSLRSLRAAWDDAVHGPTGFYRDRPGWVGDPASHFRTSVHIGGPFVDMIAALITAVDGALGHPDRLDVVDVGAGRGELLTALSGTIDPDIQRRWRPLGIDLAPRPAELPGDINWVSGPAEVEVGSIAGVLVANEWLDDIPTDVVEVDRSGVVRIVLVDKDDREVLGPALDDWAGCARYGVDAHPARTWLDEWWPLTEPGDRAEVGLARDRRWSGMVAALGGGTALAIDYGHTRLDRADHRSGTLTGYAGGRQSTPAYDGSVNLTAHVAVDSCAASIRDQVASAATTLARQRDVLPAVGLPPLATASSDPVAYTDALLRANRSAELRARGGLGDFWWIRSDVGRDLGPSTSTDAARSGTMQV